MSQVAAVKDGGREGATALTFLVVENAEGLQQLVLGTLHYAQPGLGLVLKGPERKYHAAVKEAKHQI